MAERENNEEIQRLKYNRKKKIIEKKEKDR